MSNYDTDVIKPYTHVVSYEKAQKPFSNVEIHEGCIHFVAYSK